MIDTMDEREIIMSIKQKAKPDDTVPNVNNSGRSSLR
jgi:hypothetical protein